METCLKTTIFKKLMVGLHVAQITTFLKDDVTDGQTDDGMDDGSDGVREASFFIPTSFTIYNNLYQSSINLFVISGYTLKTKYRCLTIFANHYGWTGIR
jgi:hypothetical protein